MFHWHEGCWNASSRSIIKLPGKCLKDTICHDVDRYKECIDQNIPYYDDMKIFSASLPLRRGSTGYTGDSNVELSYFICRYPEQAAEQTVEFP